MFKKSLTGIAAAATITVSALAATGTPAQAGSTWHFSVGIPGVTHGYYGAGQGYYRNPCRHWKRKWRRTGRYYYLRRYRRCMHNYD